MRQSKPLFQCSNSEEFKAPVDKMVIWGGGGGQPPVLGHQTKGPSRCDFVPEEGPASDMCSVFVVYVCCS